jgi:hypothetical protein
MALLLEPLEHDRRASPPHTADAQAVHCLVADDDASAMALLRQLCTSQAGIAELGMARTIQRTKCRKADFRNWQP